MSKKFEYTYSSLAKEEKKEIEDIRNKYLEKTEQNIKLNELKKLDKKVKKLPSYVAFVIGTIGILIFGLGLTMVLEWNILYWGIVVMAVGLVPVLISYPIFVKINNKLKAKYSEKIIRLSEELLNKK